MKDPFHIVLPLLCLFVSNIPLNGSPEPSRIQWEPLASSHLLRGVSPTATQKESVLRLAPGEETLLRLSRADLLRVELHQGAWAPDERAEDGLSMWVGDEDGLFARQRIDALRGGAFSKQLGKGHVLLRQGRDSKKTARLVLFRGRSIGFLEGLHWNPVAQPSPKGYLGTEDGPGTRLYSAISTQRPMVLSVEGPARLRLDSRALFPNGGSGASYDLLIHVDGEWRERLVCYGSQSSSLTWRDETGRTVGVGSLQRGYLTLPEGVFQVSVTPTSDVLLNLSKQGGPPLLLDRINGVVRDVPAPRVEDDLRKWVVRPESDHQKRVREVFDLARNDEVREAGLAAAALLDQMVVQHGGDGAWHLWAHEFRQRWTHFRTYLPERADRLEPLDSDKFPNLQLAHGSGTLEYRIPALPYPTEVRLHVRPRQIGEAIEVGAVFGDAEPISLRLDPNHATDDFGGSRPVSLRMRVPPGVTRVALTLPNSVGVAFQLAHGRTPRLDERQLHCYRELLGEAPLGWFLDGRPTDGESTPESLAARLLSRHFSHLAEWLGIRETDSRHSATAHSVTDLDAASATRLRNRAASLERSGDSMGALKIRRDLVLLGGREEDRLNLAHVLTDLGEHYLAERQLKWLVTHADAAEVRRRAVDTLEVRYRRFDQGRGLLSLHAAHFRREGDVAALRRLTAVLSERGEFRLAQDALALDDAPDPELAAGVALANESWSAFTRALSQMDTASRAFWRGRRALEDGDETKAIESFIAAGARGQAWVAYLQGDAEIRQKSTQTVEQAFAALLADEAHRATHPGERGWVTDFGLANGYAESRTLYHRRLNRYRQVLRATEDRPLTLRVDGPAKLQLALRHHLEEDEAPRPDSGCALWVDGGVHWIQMHRTERSQAYQVLGESSRVGTNAFHEVDLGPGHHELNLRVTGTPVLVRVRRRDVRHQPAESRTLRRPGVFETWSARGHAADWQSLAPDLVAAYLLRKPELTDHERARLAETLETLPPAQQSTAAYRIASGSDAAGGMLRPDQHPQRLMALDLARKRMFAPSDVIDPHRQMQGLLYLFREPDLKQRALVRAAALSDAFRDDPRLDPLFAAFKRETIWQVLRSVDDYAGIRPIDAQAPAANQFLRVRDILLGDPEPRVVRLWDRQSLFLTAGRRGFTFPKFRARTVFPLMSKPITMHYRFDRGARHQLVLPPGDGTWQEAGISVPPGVAQLEITVAEAPANQALEILCEPDRVRCAPERPRNFMAATRGQPLKLRLFEPTWLRVETLVGRNPVTSYRFIQDTPTTLILKPRDGERQSFYRLATRRFRREEDQRPASLERMDLYAARPFFQVAPQTFDFDRWEPEFRQGEVGPDKTWDLQVGARRREQPLDEERPDGKDEFRTVQLDWRSRDHLDAWRFRLMARQREFDNHSLGLEGLHAMPLWGGNLKTRARLFGQRVTFQTASQPDRNEWSADLQLTWNRYFSLPGRWRHRFQAQAFGRHLSLDQMPRDIRGAVDFDVFTRYKDQHKSGLRLNERFYFQPYADARLTFDLNLTTNPDVFDDVDSMGYRVGWDQLIGPLEASVFSSGRHFGKDEHRTRAYWRQRHGIDLRWRRQQRGARRLEAGIRFQITDAESRGWSIYLSRLWGARGDYRHYAAGDVMFRGLKSEHNARVEARL